MNKLLTVEEVRALVQAKVATTPGVARVELEPGNVAGLRVWMEGCPDERAAALLNIGNMHAEYERSPGHLDALIERLIARTVGMIAAQIAAGMTSLMPATWEEVRERLYLRLDRKDRLDEITRLSDGLAVPLSRPWLVPSLRAVVVYDTPTTMHHVAAHDLAAWGVDEALVFDTAERRLQGLTRQGPAFQKRSQLYALSTQDGYAASRLLAPAELRAHLPSHLRQGRLVVAIPRRDLMLMFPANRNDLVPLLISHIVAEGTPYPFTTTMLIWEGDTLTPLQPRPVRPYAA